MPDFQTFHAKIKVDGNELPEYDVQVDQDTKSVSCWVPSEAGKNFSVCWSNARPRRDTKGYVRLDGIRSGSGLIHKGDKRERTRSYCRISPTTARNFSFFPITLTDDDAYLDTPTANLGEIEIKIWTVKKVVQSRSMVKWDDPVATSNMKVHERSKKVGTHHIQFGDVAKVARVSSHRNHTCFEKVERLATFVFRYRPLEMLQANGIAPLAAGAVNAQQNTGNKRKSSQIDVLEIDSSDEDEIDRHVKELKDKLEQLESRRAKKIKVIKVEKQEHSPRLNEVIDLT